MGRRRVLIARLIGAVSLGLSQFSPDAICGITPIELMLEINGSDKSRPVDSRTPGKAVGQVNGGLDGGMESLIPIDSPLVFSGLNGDTLREFASLFQQAPIMERCKNCRGAMRGCLLIFVIILCAERCIVN